MTSGNHLHLDEYPETLSVLRELFGHRLDSAAEIGYRPTEHGAEVDWDPLIDHSWLSSTERAAVIVARGIAAAERQGGWAPDLQQVLVTAIKNTPAH
jgi:hypothetical protein